LTCSVKQSGVIWMSCGIWTVEPTQCIYRPTVTLVTWSVYTECTLQSSIRHSVLNCWPLILMSLTNWHEMAACSWSEVHGMACRSILLRPQGCIDIDTSRALVLVPCASYSKHEFASCIAIAAVHISTSILHQYDLHWYGLFLGSLYKQAYSVTYLYSTLEICRNFDVSHYIQHYQR